MRTSAAVVFIWMAGLVHEIKVHAWFKGPYKTKSFTVPVPGLQGQQQAIAYVPEAAAEDGVLFPLVSWSHGDVAGGFLEHMMYGTLLNTLASHGLVVMAHLSCEPSCGDKQYLDMLRVLDWATETHKAGNATGNSAEVLSIVNFSAPFGVSGHSTGGRSSLQSCQDDIASAHNVGAAVCFNPDPKQDSAKNCHKIPVAVFTGTKDWIEPAGSAKADFDALPADNRDKIFAEMVGIGHLDPLDICTITEHPFTPPCAKFSPYAAAFFRVHLAGDASYAPLLSGNGEHALCSNTTYKMAQCILPREHQMVVV